jgi:VCBS repeat-containing protein
VTINITAANDTPTANGDTYTTDEDTELTVGTPGVLANDTDVDGDGLTASVVTTTANGVLVFNPDGSFTYTPNADFNGTDSFTYVASDGQATSTMATVTITVTAANDDPVATDDFATTTEDTPVTVAVLDNDADVDSGTLRSDGGQRPAERDRLRQH